MDCLLTVSLDPNNCPGKRQRCSQLSSQEAGLELRRLMGLPGSFSRCAAGVEQGPGSTPENRAPSINLGCFHSSLPCILEHAQGICPFPTQAHLPTSEPRSPQVLCVPVPPPGNHSGVGWKPPITVLGGASQQGVESTSPLPETRSGLVTCLTHRV